MPPKGAKPSLRESMAAKQKEKQQQQKEGKAGGQAPAPAASQEGAEAPPPQQQEHMPQAQEQQPQVEQLAPPLEEQDTSQPAAPSPPSEPKPEQPRPSGTGHAPSKTEEEAKAEPPTGDAPQQEQPPNDGATPGVDPETEAKVTKVQAVQRKRLAQKEAEQLRAEKQQQQQQQEEEVQQRAKEHEEVQVQAQAQAAAQQDWAQQEQEAQLAQQQQEQEAQLAEQPQQEVQLAQQQQEQEAQLAQQQQQQQQEQEAQLAQQQQQQQEQEAQLAQQQQQQGQPPEQPPPAEPPADGVQASYLPSDGVDALQQLSNAPVDPSFDPPAVDAQDPALQADAGYPMPQGPQGMDPGMMPADSVGESSPEMAGLQPGGVADPSMMGNAGYEGYPPMNEYGSPDAAYADGYGMQGADPAAGSYMADGIYQEGVPSVDGAGYQDPLAGAAAPPAAPPQHDQAAMDEMLAKERERHDEQLKLETRAREELEDMILRIEKHFKAEQSARKKAEEMLQASVAAEVESRNKLEEVLAKRQQEQRLVEDERAAIQRERNALESMRQEFEAELQTARLEVSKAQEALAGSEERVRTAEQLERSRLEVDYQSKLHAAFAEKERMREELSYRTIMMNEEMEKWRQQSLLTSTAVMEAKNEVMERKRELEVTKEKMDKLLEKLYIGRERGIELSGAIASNQRMMSFMPGSMMGAGAAGSLPPPQPGIGPMRGPLGAAGGLPPLQPGMGPMGGPLGVQHGKAMMMSKAPNGAYNAPQPPIAPMQSMMPMQAWGPAPGAGHLPGELSPTVSNATKLPPIGKQNSLGMEEPYGYADTGLAEPARKDASPKAGGYAQARAGAEGRDPKNARRAPAPPSKAKKANNPPPRWN